MKRTSIPLAVASAVVLAACGGSSQRSQIHTTIESGGAGIRLISPAFAPGAAIPRQYTCDGRDVSLPLRWSGVPSATRELVLVMRDRDAPGGDFIHWAVAGIPRSTTGVRAGEAPTGGIEGRNSFGSIGYRGPCPPAGDTPHHYVITLSALGQRSGATSGFSADQIGATPLALGTLVGTYARR